MSAAKHYQTKPEDRIPFIQKIIYGIGAFTNNLLSAAIGGMMIVLNLGFGMNPALVGLLGGIPRLLDAFTDPIMGYISDNTKSKWGRRRPYIFGGAIAAGLIYILLWQLPDGKSETFYFVYFLIGSFLFYIAYTVYATPWVALGYELTPDYHERTRLMGVQNFLGQIPYLIAPWFLWIMSYKGFFENQKQGAAGLALIIGLIVMILGSLPAIFLKERFAAGSTEEGGDNPSAEKSLWENLLAFFKGFLITMKNGAFLRLCLATFLIFNGFMLIASFQYYIIIYHVFGGDQTVGAEYAGYAGTLQSISTFVVIVLTTWLGTRIGKRKAFFVSTGLFILGYALTWFCYTPALPWLVVVPAPFLAFGLGGLFVLMPSMIADVVDMDELETHQRREGMFGSIFWWTVKLGLAAALALGGYILNATGFDVNLGGNQAPRTLLLLRLFYALFPIVTSLIAIWAIATFPITEEKAYEVRMELEKRRASLAATSS
ncbi:MAG TPA: MFS transporter [Caldithrix abyssi]|uniref:MFS transporter n=1 Tax=Caldithrix abyssi TaxID=187145 RepID=A0A7V5H3Y0_CALAY|nr:MFS transporter [Caldithrix abyssi]